MVSLFFYFTCHLLSLFRLKEFPFDLTDFKIAIQKKDMFIDNHSKRIPNPIPLAKYLI